MSNLVFCFFHKKHPSLGISLVAQMVKASAYNPGDQGSIPGSGRSPGEGNGNPLFQNSCLENPRDWGAWWATVHGVAKSQQDWVTSLPLSPFIKIHMKHNDTFMQWAFSRSLVIAPVAMGPCSFLFSFILYWGVANSLTMLLVSGGQQRDSATHTDVSILPQTPFAPRLPHNIEFPVLYSRSLLVFHFKYSHVYMPIYGSMFLTQRGKGWR